MRIKAIVSVTGLAVALALVGVPAASASLTRFESHLQITSAETDYSGSPYTTYLEGNVKSRKHACLHKRRVRIRGFYHGKWQHYRGWRTKTNSDGLWEFFSQQNGIVAASKLKAKVLRERLPSGNICQADWSKPVEATQAKE